MPTNPIQLASGISGWPEDERPRERLLTRGPHALSDAELIAILLRVGMQGKSAVEMGRELLIRFGSVPGMMAAPISAWEGIKGLGDAKLAQLQAALELGRRASLPGSREKTVIKSTRQAAEYFTSRLRGLAEEHFRVAYLNRQGRLLGDALIAKGTLSANRFHTLSTRQRQSDSVSAAELRRDKTVFFTDQTRASLKDEQIEFFDEISEPGSGFRCIPVANRHDFKTPLNATIADSDPEQRFIKALLDGTNLPHYQAWIKSTSTRFYEIDYAWKKGEHPKRGKFNPDFFIKAGNLILVVETKGNEELRDSSDENRKKNEYAVAHFDRVNEHLAQEGSPIRYKFNFLTPKSFGTYFQYLREGRIAEYRSELDVKLEEAE